MEENNKENLNNEDLTPENDLSMFQDVEDSSDIKEDLVSETVDEVPIVEEIKEADSIETVDKIVDEPVVEKIKEVDAIVDEPVVEKIEKIEEKEKKPLVETLDVDNSDDFQEDNGLITVRPVKFQDFKKVEANRSIKKNLDIMLDVPMHVSVELGRTKTSIKEAMDLDKGSIIELQKIAGEQVEIFVNQKLVAKGEVIVIEDKFGVRVTSTNFPKTTI